MFKDNIFFSSNNYNSIKINLCFSLFLSILLRYFMLKLCHKFVSVITMKKILIFE